ncbi:hypothetical protein D3C76_1597120 [compost metagenome]
MKLLVGLVPGEAIGRLVRLEGIELRRRTLPPFGVEREVVQIAGRQPLPHRLKWRGTGRQLCTDQQCQRRLPHPLPLIHSP